MENTEKYNGNLRKVEKQKKKILIKKKTKKKTKTLWPRFMDGVKLPQG